MAIFYRHIFYRQLFYRQKVTVMATNSNCGSKNPGTCPVDVRRNSGITVRFYRQSLPSNYTTP
ncbi:hypothetical protein BJV82DRAFT_624819, partial [Fennellomyces sp. T-0311]